MIYYPWLNFFEVFTCSIQTPSKLRAILPWIIERLRSRQPVSYPVFLLSMMLPMYKSFICTGYYTMMWMLRALWLVVAYDLSEDRYMDDVTRNLFTLFCSEHGAAVLNMFVVRIKASDILERYSTGAIYKKEKWRNGDKKSSWLL